MSVSAVSVRVQAWEVDDRGLEIADAIVHQWAQRFGYDSDLYRALNSLSQAREHTRGRMPWNRGDRS